MKITRTVKWKTKAGQNVDVEIIRTRNVENEVAYADGQNIELGKKTIDRLEIVLSVDGVRRDSGSNEPKVITKSAFGRYYEELVQAGAYARLGNMYISRDNYHLVMTALAEIEAELTETAEYAEVKAAEAAKEAEKEANILASKKDYEAKTRNGWCPKCESYCYGDCD